MERQTVILDRHAFLPAFAIARPVTILMVLLSFCVLGVVAYLRLPLAMAPESLDAPVLFISLPYPNSDPREVERKILKPVEDALASLKGLDRIDGTAGSDGATVFMLLRQEVPVDPVYAEVKDRLERLEKELPADFERYFIFRWRASDWPVLVVGFAAGSGEIDELYRLIDEKIKVRLQRIDGVASIETDGLRERRVVVELLQDRLEAHQVDISQVYQSLSRGNFSLSGGTVKEGGLEHYVRTLARFESLEEIRRLPIPGSAVTLGTLAEVRSELPEIERVTEVDGRHAVILLVKKEFSANTVKVCEEALAAIEELKADPEAKGLEHFVFFSQGNMVASSLGNLLGSGYWGAFFAIFILYGFLRRLRPTLIIAMSIPLSLMMTLVVLYFLGMSLNIGTMLGLMISVGMLVDNSIVVVENIFRLRDEGLSPRDAALRGTSEVGIAISASTATTGVVFLPLIFMSGGIGIWMREIGLPVVIAIAVSLFVALTVIPLATAHMPRRHAVSTEERVGRYRRLYARFLGLTLRRRAETFLGLLLVLGLTSGLASSALKFTDDPASDRRRVFMHLHFETPGTLDQARSSFFRLRDLFEAHREELEVKNIYLGFDHVHGDVELFLTPKRKRMSTEEVAQRVREIVPKFPGAILRVNDERQENGESISVLLQGEDSALLETFAVEALRRLEGVSGISDLSTGLDEQRDEINVSIDRMRSWKQGLNPQAIAGVVALGVRGRKVGVYRGAGANLDVIVQLGKENRQNLESLKNLPLPVRPQQAEPGPPRAIDATFGVPGPESGARTTDAALRSLPLSTMAEFRFSRGLGEIHHLDGLASLEIKATTLEKDVEALRGRIVQALAGFELPRGYGWTFGSRFQRWDQQESQSSLSALLAALCVFLIMGVLFESFVHPLTVMLTLPFGWLGFVWMMAATQTPVDILGSVGLIVLIGVVVNNSIVVVDRINQLRSLGWEREAAIVQAGTDRVRPVLMTAGTTILGLVPMALDATAIQYHFNEFLLGLGLGFLQLGSGNSSEILYNSLGRAIMGGMIAGTISTLLLTPYFYLAFDELRLYLRRVASTLWPRRLSAPQA